MRKKTTLKAKTKPTPPIVVALPNTTREKMVAILATAQALESVAKALLSTNVAVTIEGCYITTPDVGIKIDAPESA